MVIVLASVFSTRVQPRPNSLHSSVQDGRLEQSEVFSKSFHDVGDGVDDDVDTFDDEYDLCTWPASLTQVNLDRGRTIVAKASLAAGWARDKLP